MKERFRRGLAFLLSFAMLLGMTTTASAESASAGSTNVAPGTYSVPVSNSDPVAAMNTEFGGVVADTATAVVKADGTVSMTLTLKAIKVMTSYDAWIDSFNGYYEGGYEDGKAPTAIDIKSVGGTLTAENGTEYPALAEATFTASSLQSSYTLAYHLKSTVMEFDRHPVLTVDWANRKALAGDKTALNAKIKEVSEMDSSAYTAESWDKLAEVTNAAGALAGDADQTAIDNALAAINEAIAALVAAAPAPEGAVASITAADGTVTYYTSLFDKAEVSDEEGNVTSPAVPGAVSSLKAGETLTLIKDEEFTGVQTKAEQAEADFHLDGSAVFNMNGKTVHVTGVKNNCYAFRVSAGSLSVQGGTLKVENSGGWRVDAGANLTISGDHKASATYATVDCYGGVTVNKGVYLENVGNSNVVWGGGKNFIGMTLDGVTIYANSSGGAVTTNYSIPAESSVSIKDCVITSEKSVCMAINGKTSAELINNTVKCNSSSVAAMNINNSMAVTIEGGTYETAGTYGVITNSSSPLTVNSGKFKASLGGIRANGSSKVVYPEGKILNNTPDEEGWYVLIDEKDYVPKKVVQIGTTTYEDLDKALAAIKDGQTAILLEDALLMSSTSLGKSEENVSYTIDLNGHNLMLSSQLAIYNGTLTVTDTSGSKAAVNLNAYLRAEQTGSLTLKGITVNSEGSSNNIICYSTQGSGVQIYNCVFNQNGQGTPFNGQGFYYTTPFIMKNTEINCTGAGYFGININEESTAEHVLENVTVHAEAEAERALLITGGTATMKNCTVSGAKTGLYVGSDDSPAAVTLENCTVSGTDSAISAGPKSVVNIESGSYDTNGTYAVLADFAKVAVNGGTFGAVEVSNGFVMVPDGKKLALNSENRWELTDKTGDEPAEEVAAVVTYADGTTKNISKLEYVYFFLDGTCTVKVMKDAVLTTAIDVPAGVNLTFDLNGKTITGYSEDGSYISGLFYNMSGTLKLTDTSEAQDGKVLLKKMEDDENYTAIAFMCAGEVSVDAGYYSANMISGLLSKTMSVTGGTWDVGGSYALAFNGGVVITGGRFSNNGAEIKKAIKSGYQFTETADADGFYAVVEKEVVEAYPAATVLRNSEGTVQGSDGGVRVDMDGKAWLAVAMDSVDPAAVTEVKTPAGASVAGIKTETDEDGTVRLFLPLESVYNVAPESEYSPFNQSSTAMAVTVGSETYYMTVDWAAYAGPVGASTASDTAVNVKAEVAAMGTKMEFNVTGTMYTFENGYTFLKMPIDEMAKQYSSSSGIAFGDIKNFADEDGKEPVYKLMEKAPADMSNFDKFEQFDYVKNLLVSTDSMQEQATMTIAVKVNAMGFDVDLEGALVTWDNPNVTLDKLIADAEQIVSEGADGYTAESWKALTDALAAAKDVKNNASASEEEKDAAKAALKAAIKGLEEVTDWTALNEAIDKAEALKEADYTEETWAAVKEALAAAKDAVTAGTADQTEADTLAANLNDAMAALVKKDTGDKKAMKPGTYEVTVDMRKAGKTSETSMAAAVMDKKGTLTVAEDGSMKLKLTFPKDAMIAGLSSHATGIDVYEEDGTTKMAVEYTTYETTLYEGISASGPSYTGQALTDATISLSYEAEDGIYKAYIYADRMQNDVALYVDFSNVARVGDGGDEPAKADKTQLADVIGKAESLKEDDYTADSWKKVQDALAAAKTVNADENATQDEVTAAMNNLTTVMSQLVKKGTDQDGKIDKDFTPGTYNTPITMIVDAMNQSFLIDGHVVIAEDGTASMLIDFSRISTDGGKTWVSAYDSGTVYYLAFNGYSKDGTSSNLTTEGAELTWIDVAGKDKDGNDVTYHCLDKVTFPLPYLTTDSQGIAQYLVSLKFFVPGMSHLEFAEDGFDYLVKMNVDLSEVPVKITVDPDKDNNNDGNGNGNGNGSGGLVIPGATTTTRPGTSGVTGISGASGVKISKTGVNTGDTLNTLPWAAAFGIAALAIALLALEEKLRRRAK